MIHSPANIGNGSTNGKNKRLMAYDAEKGLLVFTGLQLRYRAIFRLGEGVRL